MPISNIIPAEQEISIAVEPAHIAVQNMWLLVQAERLSGLGEWVGATLRSMTPEEREKNNFILVAFYFLLIPDRSWYGFPEFIDFLAKSDAVRMRDHLLEIYAGISKNMEKGCLVGMENKVDVNAVLESEESYVEFLKEHFCEENLYLEIEKKAYRYLCRPDELRKLIVDHLRGMWELYLKPEWEKSRKLIEEAAAAFRAANIRSMDKVKAAEFITGHDMEEKGQTATINNAKRIVFIPSTQIGPYMAFFCGGTTLWIFFGARLPEGAVSGTSDLSRMEILVRLNTLADDVRLQILSLIREKGELKSQEVMDALDLSQSAASRHLKQLSASGYLLTRRCSGANCYTLNRKRIKSTLAGIAGFLLGQDRE